MLSNESETGSGNLTVADFAKKIIAEAKAAYPEDFLKIIPEDLQQKQVSPESIKEIIDNDIQELFNKHHKDSPQRAKFLTDLANEIESF